MKLLFVTEKHFSTRLFEQVLAEHQEELSEHEYRFANIVPIVKNNDHRFLFAPEEKKKFHPLVLEGIASDAYLELTMPTLDQSIDRVEPPVDAVINACDNDTRGLLEFKRFLETHDIGDAKIKTVHIEDYQENNLLRYLRLEGLEDFKKELDESPILNR